MNKRQKTVELIFILLFVLSIATWISSNLVAPFDMSTAGFAIIGFLSTLLFLFLSLAYPIFILWKNKRNI